MKLNAIREKVAALECKLIREALEQDAWNQSATARTLDCRLTTLRRIIERHPKLAEAIKHLGLPQGRPADELGE